MSTLHTLDATETINRIISVFPPYQQKQVRMQLGSTLRAVISQRLVPKSDGRGRVAAVEVLIATTRVREMIEDKDRTKELPDAISQGHVSYGMQTFDQSLMGLLKQSLVTYDEALRQATNPDDFALRVSGISGTSDSSWDDFEGKPPSAPPPPVLVPVPTPAAAAKPAAPAASAPLPPRAAPPAAAKPPGPAKVGPPAPAPAPAAAPEVLGDDDFQIERF
jgi:twitching motility protein PilT